MAKELPYQYSLRYAVKYGEKDEWRESHKKNCECARAIEQAINENYEDNRLSECATAVIDCYGFDRVNFVLANTVKRLNEDGRISEQNKSWAKGFYIPYSDDNLHYTVGSHPGLVDIFVNQARAAWKSLGLYDITHCESEKDERLDYTDRLLIIDARMLDDECKTSDNQLFYATGGNGCRPNARGRKIFGRFLNTGEETYYYRDKFIGAIKDEYIPEWAKEKLEEFNATAEEETEDMTMGGM